MDVLMYTVRWYGYAFRDVVVAIVGGVVVVVVDGVGGPGGSF